MINQSDETQEKITIIDKKSPENIAEKTTRLVEPQVKGNSAQKVYQTKKAIFRFDQVIWYISGLIEVLLGFRLVFKALGANSYSGFTNFVYSATNPLVTPFRGILGTSNINDSTIEWSTIIAGVVYLCIAWGLVYLLDLIYPITPEDVEMK